MPVLLLAACENAEAGRSSPAGELQATGADDAAQVVAEVGAQRITSGDVRDVMRGSGLGARAALERLVRERLLAAEAHRRGFGQGATVERAARKAAVHALLARLVEAPNTAQRVPQALLQKRLDEAVERATRPERRRADHILFRVDEKASDAQRALAREGAQQALAELSSGSVDAVLARYRGLGKFRGEIDVKVEELPPLARTARTEKPFLEALFAAAVPGPLGEVVATRYGLHAVVLREILPPEVPEPATLEPSVREKLMVERRRERTQALLEQARQATEVTYQPQVIASAFADTQWAGR